jgi:CSLREA domain-containing protein
VWRRGVGKAWPIILSLGVAMITPASAAATAPSVTVTTLLDTNTAGDGKCSLREAVNNINTQSEKTMGDCATGVGTTNIDFSVSGTITLSMGVITLGGAEASVEIEGGNTITLDGVTRGEMASFIVRAFGL